MATYTDNYNLEKPAQSDLYNIDVFNENADKVDDALGSKAANQSLAPIESTSTATRNYSIGQQFVYNGLLYEATAAIASGGTITPGTNCARTTVAEELSALNDSLTNLSSTVSSLIHSTILEPAAITDTTNGFIDAGISTANYAIIAAYALTTSNISYRISNLNAGGNYRLQEINAVNGSVVKSGNHQRVFIWYIDR